VSPAFTLETARDRRIPATGGRGGGPGGRGSPGRREPGAGRGDVRGVRQGIDNDRPRQVRFRLRTPKDRWNFQYKLDAAAWLGGRAIRIQDETNWQRWGPMPPIDNPEILALDPGRYPLMIQVGIGKTEGWGKIWMAPRFVDVTEERRREQAAYEKARADWAAYLAKSQELFVLE
jgi:hypothetical protein